MGTSGADLHLGSLAREERMQTLTLLILVLAGAGAAEGRERRRSSVKLRGSRCPLWSASQLRGSSAGDLASIFAIEGVVDLVAVPWPYVPRRSVMKGGTG